MSNLLEVKSQQERIAEIMAYFRKDAASVHALAQIEVADVEQLQALLVLCGGITATLEEMHRIVDAQ